MRILKARFVDQSPADPFWRRLHRIADRHIPDFQRTFLASAQRIRLRITDDMVADDMALGLLEPPKRLLELLEGYAIAKAVDPAELATGAYAEILSETGGEVIDMLERLESLPVAGLKASFTVTNPSVLRAAETLTAYLVREVGDDTRAAIRRIVFDAVKNGIPPAESAKLIRSVVGLTERQALSVARFRANLGDIKNADRLTARFAERRLKDRAMTIARTETMRAANRGQQLAWQALERDSLIDTRRFSQRWLTTADDRLCPRCAPMNGKTVHLGGSFSETERGVLPSERVPVAGQTTESPPLHPRCRCTLVAVFEEPSAQPSIIPEAPPLPGVSEGDLAAAFDALMPKRGGWTTVTRKKTLEAIKASGKDGKILADTLTQFQRTGSIARLRGQIERHLAGTESNERARVLIRALRAIDPERMPKTLHRGMSVKGTPTEVLDNFFGVGKTFDTNFSSYSTDKALAESFANVTAKKNTTRVMLKLEGEVRAVPLENLGQSRVFAAEREWATAGRFEVVSSKVGKIKDVSTGEFHEAVIVTIRQVQVI